jgi:exodeoxyribonuclease V beta subunit
MGSPPTDDEAERRFRELAEAAPGSISVERSTLGSTPRWTEETTDAGPLSASLFDREIDRIWRRTSYSDITSGAYEARVASEPEEAALSDEPSEPQAATGTDGGADHDLMGRRSLFSGVPVGLQVGTFVHRILQETDFAAPDLEEELRGQILREQARRDVDVGDREGLVAGLRAAIETPLGPLVDDLRLCDVEWADRLEEAEFELPLVGGDRPANPLALHAIADVLRQELEPDDPFRTYASRLIDPSLRHSISGYLAGSIDLVLRMPDQDDRPRFAIIDYKTNWLARPGEELTAWHYRPAALADEMARGHYPLQALLYAVALHRYLRWRLTGYEPDAQFAGILYLFMRGMSGPETPSVGGDPCGVFAWRPPIDFLANLSDLLDRGAPG